VIIDAAMSLFDEHGFDGVTVTEIAARADVGRTTFFRYFKDKQEVLFADDAELLAVLTDSAAELARELAPIGDSLTDAIAVAHAGMRALLVVIVARSAGWLPLRDRLIAQNPPLAARSLVKERRYGENCAALLLEHGATLDTAALAVGVGAACYWTAQAVCAKDPNGLPDALDAAFRRLADLDRAALLARL
jgi:AcrR family transcriptional regulator